MSRTSLIVRHEFGLMVRRKAFIITTLAVPVLALLAIGIGRLVSGAAAPQRETTVRIGYVDASGLAEQPAGPTSLPLVKLATTEDATAALLAGTIKEYVVIPADYVDGGTIRRFTATKEMAPPAATMAAVKSMLTMSLLAGKVTPTIAALIDAPLRVSTTRLDATGSVAADQGGIGAALVPMAFSMLLALSILLTSGYLLQGLGEEKESRLMEVMISIVSPRELLSGKVIGLGAAGLVQVVVWLSTLPLLLGLGSAVVGGFVQSLRVPASFYALGFAYFLLGYLLVAVLSAGVGAISPNAREAQQLAVLLTLLPMVPLWFMGLFIAFPGNPAWVVLSIFPLTAPTMVMARLGISEIPAWQLATSLIVLAGSVAGGLFLAVRAFGAYLLLYGKRPRLAEVVRNLKAR
jgi:ABC-2 type transport system permease protein